MQVRRAENGGFQVSYSLNSLKEVMWGITIGDVRRNTVSLDCSSSGIYVFTLGAGCSAFFSTRPVAG